VLAAEHLLRLGRFDFPGESIDAAGQIGEDVLAFGSPLREDRQVVLALSKTVDQVAFLFQAAAALQDLLRFGLVFPEVRGCGACFELSQFVGGM